MEYFNSRKKREQGTAKDLNAYNRGILGNSAVQRMIYEGIEGQWRPYCARSEANRYDLPEEVTEGVYFDAASNRFYQRAEMLPIRLRRAQERAAARAGRGEYRNVTEYYGAKSAAAQAGHSFEITTPFGSCTAERGERGICIVPRYSYADICRPLDAQSVPVKRDICGLILNFLGSAPEANMELARNRRYAMEIGALADELKEVDFLQLEERARIKVFRAYCFIRQSRWDFIESAGLVSGLYQEFTKTLREVREVCRQGVSGRENYGEMLDFSIDILQDDREAAEEAREEGRRRSEICQIMSDEWLDEDEAAEELEKRERRAREEKAREEKAGGEEAAGGGFLSDSDDISVKDSMIMTPEQKTEAMDSSLHDMPSALEELAQAAQEYVCDRLLFYGHIPPAAAMAANVLCGILAAAESSPIRNPTGGKWERAAMREVEKKLNESEASAAVAFSSVFCGGDAPYIPSRTPEEERTLAGSRFPVGGTQQGRNYISGRPMYETEASVRDNLEKGQELLTDASDSSEG